MIAQLGERQTEDLKVPGSIPGRGIFLNFEFYSFISYHCLIQGFKPFLCKNRFKELSEEFSKKQPGQTNNSHITVLLSLMYVSNFV